jgi:hypothetical protein
MSRIGGCVLALVGVAVAVCSVIGGLMDFYGAVDGHAGAEGVYVGLVLSGGKSNPANTQRGPHQVALSLSCDSA